MESDTMELLRLMLAHLRPRLQGRDEEWQALERKQQELMASFRETHGGDVPLLLGITLFSALFVCAGNLIANLLYGVVDPRIREVEA